MPEKILLSLLAALALAGTALADARVLLYHRVGDSRYPSTNVSVENFRAQLNWIKEKGYTVVPTAALEAHLLRGEPLAENAVVLQFDDALRTVYTTAFPILREFGYPFSIFVTTQAVDRGYPDYVTWPMLLEMVKAGAEVGIHGHSHQKMAGAEKGESREAFLKRIRYELAEPRKSLAAHGLKSDWFAYTFGEYGPELVAATKEEGFKLGFVQDPGAVNKESDPHLLNRYAVVGSVAELKLFKERMGYGALTLTERTPGYGHLKGGAPPLYRARVAHPERYLPGSAGIYVSELGGLATRFDPATGIIEAAGGRKLGNKLNRVVVTIKERDTGRFAMASWAIINGDQ